MARDGDPDISRDEDGDLQVKRLQSVGLVMVMMMVCATACNDRHPSSDEIYIRNPNPGSIDPFCRWEDDPSPPKGTVAHRIGKSVPLGDRSSCEDFEVEEIDALLVAEYWDSVADGCDPEPYQLLRGCFDENGDRCAFSAFVYSQCPLTTSR